MKTLLIILLLFNITTYGQDTTYYQRQKQLYMTIRTKVNDVTTYKQHYNVKKHKANNRFLIIVGTVFTALTVWFFQPISK